jgi:hypothetical protein
MARGCADLGARLPVRAEQGLTPQTQKMRRSWKLERQEPV